MLPVSIALVDDLVNLAARDDLGSLQLGGSDFFEVWQTDSTEPAR